MAVKIVRQEKSIVLLGVPTSSAAPAAGHERAPAALRAAGLAARLTEAGFAVTDHGDCTARVFAPDEEHPRARNVRHVLATLEELRPKVEMVVKSGGLPLVLGGDTSIVLATIAAARRYYKNISLIFLDRDADLKEPATTTSGSVNGMVISHVLGRGAPELVRFWGEPPLVRAPDVALFGIADPGEAEQKFLDGSPLRRYTASDVRRRGGEAVATEALEQVHGRAHEFVLHLDLNVIATHDFRAVSPTGAGDQPSAGLPLSEVRQALAVFAREPNLAALVVSSYNPALDTDGESAKKLIELLVEILSPRLLAPEPEDAPTAEEQPHAQTASDETPVDAPRAESSRAGSATDQASVGASREQSSPAASTADEHTSGNSSIENASVEDQASESRGSQVSSVESPQSTVERESPTDTAVHSVSPDSPPSSSSAAADSGSDRSVERESPDI